jgi:hypothetical protein
VDGDEDAEDGVACFFRGAFLMVVLFGTSSDEESEEEEEDDEEDARRRLRFLLRFRGAVGIS